MSATGKWRWIQQLDDDEWRLYGPRYSYGIKFGGIGGTEMERIAACLNACEGIPTEALVAGEAITKEMAVDMMIGIGMLVAVGALGYPSRTASEIGAESRRMLDMLGEEQVEMLRVQFAEPFADTRADMIDVWRKRNAMTRADEAEDPRR